MAEKKRSGARGRKINRQKNKPAHARYNQDKRWNENKLRKAKKYVKKFGFPVKIKYNDKLITVQ